MRKTEGPVETAGASGTFGAAGTSASQNLRRMKCHDSSFPSGRKEQRLLLASSVVTMVYGGHLHLVRDTKIHTLCGRSHRALDRTQPIYELAECVRGGGRSQDCRDDRTDDRGSLDCR